MGLKHAVITSVTRDDLPDGGAAHWREVILAVREACPGTTIEVLIPDFGGRAELLDAVLEARPDITAHNIETVSRLTPAVRSRAEYRVSLDVLRGISARGFVAKSGLMAGLGETPEEVLGAMDDLREAGVSIVTLGQYLRPTMAHMPVVEYVTPTMFEFYRQEALARGFSHVASGPLVRSSYMAEESLKGSAIRLVQPTVKLIDAGEIEYEKGLALQKELFEKGGGYIILCEHPHVYTLGRNGRAENLLVSEDFLREKGAALYRTERGGDITYHGPGQIVGYPILDLEKTGLGLREYIGALEQSVIETVAEFGMEAGRAKGKTGVWIGDARGERKICAIGVKARRGVVMHGFALNVSTDLGWFGLINPCGSVGGEVTSLERETGRKIATEEVKRLLVERLKTNLRIII